jgi:uncharacterized membrane protein
VRVPVRTALKVLVALAGSLPWVFAALCLRPPVLVQVFHSLCHQMPERTLVVAGVPMLVCSRCAGLYAGLALGVAACLPRTWVPHGRAIVAGALLLALADVATQDLGLHAPWHPGRLATGLLLGWAASGFMFGAIEREARSGQPAIASPAAAPRSLCLRGLRRLRRPTATRCRTPPLA